MKIIIGHAKLVTAILFALLWSASFCVLSSTALAEPIPGIMAIPDGLSDELFTKLTRERQALEEELKAFLAAADKFNNTPAEEQTDAGYAALQARRALYVSRANAFNQEVANAPKGNAGSGYGIPGLPGIYVGGPREGPNTYDEACKAMLSWVKEEEAKKAGREHNALNDLRVKEEEIQSFRSKQETIDKLGADLEGLRKKYGAKDFVELLKMEGENPQLKRESQALVDEARKKWDEAGINARQRSSKEIDKGAGKFEEQETAKEKSKIQADDIIRMLANDPELNKAKDRIVKAEEIRIFRSQQEILKKTERDFEKLRQKYGAKDFLELKKMEGENPQLKQESQALVDEGLKKMDEAGINARRQALKEMNDEIGKFLKRKTEKEKGE